MPQVTHIDESEAIQTVRALLSASPAGQPSHAATLWINILRRDFGLLYRPDPGTCTPRFVRPV